MKSKKCPKCGKMIKKGTEAYLHKEVLCQRCWYKEKCKIPRNEMVSTIKPRPKGYSLK